MALIYVHVICVAKQKIINTEIGYEIS